MTRSAPKKKRSLDDVELQQYYVRQFPWAKQALGWGVNDDDEETWEEIAPTEEGGAPSEEGGASGSFVCWSAHCPSFSRRGVHL